MRTAIITAFLMLFALGCAPRSVAALTADDLKRSIQSRSDELQRVNQQIQEAQRQLMETQGKKRTLNQEVRQFDYSIRQIDLNIKSSEIRIEQLLLEIQALSLDIQKNEDDTAMKRTRITDLLRELAEKDQEHILLTLLNGKSLAEGLLETQTLTSLNEELTNEVMALKELKDELTAKLEETETKKSQVQEQRRVLGDRKTIAENQREDRKDLLSSTKNQEKLYEKQLTDLQKRQADIVAEIEAVERELRAKIDPNLLPTPRAGVFQWPAQGGRLSQGYGRTAFAQYTYPGKYHNGVDIAGPIGTEVYTAEDGIVVAVMNQDRFCPRGAYGKLIVIRHANGLTTLYAHLSQQIVKEGDLVKRGQPIAYMGKTGWATGPHLHFTVWSTPTYAVRSTRVCGAMPVGGDIDPLQYLERPASS